MATCHNKEKYFALVSSVKGDEQFLMHVANDMKKLCLIWWACS